LAVSPTQVAFDGRILPDTLRINFTTGRGGGCLRPPGETLGAFVRLVSCIKH